MLSWLSRYPELRIVRIVRVGDVDTGRAKDAAAEYDLPAWGDDGDLYADDSVDIVVNLTPPVHHAATITAAWALVSMSTLRSLLPQRFPPRGKCLVLPRPVGESLGPSPTPSLVVPVRPLVGRSTTG
jgi:hypothetical protein